MFIDHNTDTTKFKIVFLALLILGVIAGNSFYKSKMKAKELFIIDESYIFFLLVDPPVGESVD